MRSTLTNLMVVSTLKIALLKNIYSVIAVDPTKVPSANFNLAKEFIYWMATGGESVVKNYTIDGVQVFTPYLNYTGTSPSGSSLDDVYNGTFGSNLGNPSAYLVLVASPTSCGTSEELRSLAPAQCEAL
jgi:hypothetical protein